MKKRVLIIDANNMFIRAYIVDPSLSTNGQPIGGLKGFLKILQKQIRETTPDEVVIAWDGADGSRRRKDMNKNYKAGRKPIRLNRNVRNLSENEELENKIWQQTRTFEYLNEMPITQLMLPMVEADDIISYVSQSPYYKGWQKVIVSSDKDFLQLCDNETVLYRPIQKKAVNKQTVIDVYGVHRRTWPLPAPSPATTLITSPASPGLVSKPWQSAFRFLLMEKTAQLIR
jgi:5'-3' exonuclease